MKKTVIAIALASMASIGFNTPLWAESSISDSDTINISSPTDASESLEEMNRDLPEIQAVPMHADTKSFTVQINASDYIGKNVIGYEGEEIGTIEKLVTKNDGPDTYAVIGIGGFLGMGQKDAAIPLHELTLQGDKWSLANGITKELLKNEMLYEEAEFSGFNMDASQPVTQPGEIHGNKSSENTELIPTETEANGNK
jgi:hypothetical protein